MIVTLNVGVEDLITFGAAGLLTLGVQKGIDSSGLIRNKQVSFAIASMVTAGTVFAARTYGRRVVGNILYDLKEKHIDPRAK